MITHTVQKRATRETTRPPLGRTHRRWSRYSNRSFYTFIAPWLLGFIFLTLFPMLYALGVSFTNYDGISSYWHWVGFRNYIELIYDSATWFSLGRSVLYVVLVVPLSIMGGLGLALLINRPVRGVGIFRTIFYLPAVVPIVASAITWRLIFDPDTGPLNGLLEIFHLPDVNWLGDSTVFLALIILVLWGMGSGMILSLAGLQSIPQELKEAAIVDGANPWQSFFSVTLPMLTPVLFFQVVTGIIASLQVLVQPLLLSSSGVSGDANILATLPRSNYLYMVNVYAQFFSNQRFGYGAALLWVLFFFILLMTLLVFRSSALWVFYEVEQD